MEDKDFYNIEIYDDGKYINPNGYFYYADDNTDTPYRFVTYHRIMKLDEFLAMNNEEKDEWLAETVKYIYDLTEKEYMEQSKEEIKKAVKLPFDKLNMDTPVGYYHT